MSEIKVNKISPRTACGTTTLGDSGDTFTLPSGGTLTIACGATITNNGTQTGFGREGTVNWDTTAKTVSFTAVSGNGYFVNTTSGAVTMTLPASPSAGDIVAVADYANTFATNNLTIARNGSLINGGAFDYDSSTNGISLTFVYVDGTRGWKNVNDGTTNATGISDFIVATGGTVVTCGNFKTHIFTGPGTFCVSGAGTPAGSTTLDYFVVAGGGSGITAGYGGGGGGAGGFRLSNGYSLPSPTTSPLAPASNITATVQGYPITVGGGGAVPSNPGSNSVFSTITSTGGGAGTQSAPGGSPGGSGGGGGGAYAGTYGEVRPGGSGNQPPVSPPQGNDGGDGRVSPAPGAGNPYTGGGGGGAGAVGANFAGAGGDGSYIADAFIGPTAPSYGESGPVSSTRYFAGGGGGNQVGGGGIPTSLPQGAGGVGGGGDANGPNGPRPPADPGVANTGGGGGGGGAYPGPQICAGAGGSGIVMIRYKYQ